MSKIQVLNSKGKEIDTIALDEGFLKKRINTRVLYYVVNNYLASRHLGTHKTKKRDEVRGGGKKPWRQKGTGRARAGSIRSPLWRGGGVVFGPVVRSYAYSIPRKTKRLALLEAVRSKMKDGDFIVFDGITLEKPKTKDMAAIIRSMKLGRKCLMVVEKMEKNVLLSSRNIAGFSLKHLNGLNAFDVLSHKKLALSRGSMEKLLKGLE